MAARIIALLVGRGRDRWLYLFCWLLVAALWPVHVYFRDQQPGGGPDGGEAYFILLILIAIGWMNLAVVNAVRLFQRLRMPGWVTYLLAPASGMATMALALVVTFVWPPATFPGFLLVTACFAGPNLAVMAGVRRLRR